MLDAAAEDLTATALLVQRVGRAMTVALGATGVVVLNASGPHTGQSVRHLHVNVVPCRCQVSHRCGGDGRGRGPAAIRGGQVSEVARLVLDGADRWPGPLDGHRPR